MSSTQLVRCVVACLTVAIAVSVRADTVSFPKDDPSLSVDVPSGWRSDFIPAGQLPGGARVQFSSESGAGDLSIKELPEGAAVKDDASAKAAVTKLAMQDMKEFEASATGNVQEATVAGHKSYSTEVTTGIGKMFYAIFTPNGETYFSMFSIGGGGEPIVKVIKAAE